MKKVSYFIFILLLVFTCIAFTFRNSSVECFSSLKELHYPNGVDIPGYTGAPGEFNCGDCHNCDALPAGLISRFLVTDSLNNEVKTYIPNHTYIITYRDTIVGNKGFQCTVLNDSNWRAGDLMVGQNTQISTLLNKKTNKIRQYINHIDPFSSKWVFKWKAPSLSMDRVTFYFSTGNYQVIYLSNFSLLPQQSTGGISGIKINENAFAFTCYYSTMNNSLFMHFKSPEEGKGYLNIVDELGKSVYYKKLGELEFGYQSGEYTVPFQLPKGIYVVQLFVNNYFATKRIVI